MLQHCEEQYRAQVLLSKQDHLVLRLFYELEADQVATVLLAR